MKKIGFRSKWAKIVTTCAYKKKSIKNQYSISKNL